MLKIYFLATFYLGYFQNPKKNVAIPKKNVANPKKNVANPKKMLPFQLATFWYVVFNFKLQKNSRDKNSKIFEIFTGL